jgi:hypothetical protein
LTSILPRVSGVVGRTAGSACPYTHLLIHENVRIVIIIIVIVVVAVVFVWQYGTKVGLFSTAVLKSNPPVR